MSVLHSCVRQRSSKHAWMKRVRPHCCKWQCRLSGKCSSGLTDMTILELPNDNEAQSLKLRLPGLLFPSKSRSTCRRPWSGCSVDLRLLWSENQHVRADIAFCQGVCSQLPAWVSRDRLEDLTGMRMRPKLPKTAHQAPKKQ